MRIPIALQPFAPLFAAARAAYRKDRSTPAEVLIVGVPVLVGDWPSEVARCWNGFDACPPPEQDGRRAVLAALSALIVDKQPVAELLRFQAGRLKQRARAKVAS